MTTADASGPRRLSRVLAQLTSAGGALLVTVAGLTTFACAVLGALVVRARDGVGSWIPLAIAILAAALVCALAIDRHRLVTELRRQPLPGGPTVLVSTDPVTGDVLDTDTVGPEAVGPGAVGPEVVGSAAVGPRTGTGGGWRAARAEFDLRRPTRLPRVEAAQRALRAGVGTPASSPWLERDLRPTLVLFVATALAVPVTATTAIIAALVLLTS